MNRIAVRTEQLGKRYRIRHAKRPRLTQPTLSETLVGALRARFDNLIARRDTGSAHLRGDKSIVWALRDVSFELLEGEVLGVIGRNGAGKSTLLKILSRITEPTCGWAEITGRVGSLLEVGTGFHPDLTGRQNVYLNGTILGMDRREIARRFEEIVEFAGVGEFIDTPVKHYSSGMQVRLAFAVAAHFEPEVMIVDEVLAVGDAEFQRKCLSKMDDVARGGRTVLFVSHNMNAIQRLCTRCILIERGHIVADGPTADVTSRYLTDGFARTAACGPMTWVSLSSVEHWGTGQATFVSLRYRSDNSTVGYHAYPAGPLQFTLEIASDRPRRVGSLAVTVYDEHGTVLVNADSIELGVSADLRLGSNFFALRIEALHLKPGTYVLGLWLAEATHEPVYDHVRAACPLEVVDLQGAGLGSHTIGVVSTKFSWNQTDPESN
jgi:ABC-type polysaccharide/polyol phosphate transport system ATPase subunit